MGYLDLADRTWPLLTRLMGGHTAVYRATGGRIGHRTPGLPPVLLLDHVGARSGIRRTSPLVYGVDGKNFILVASKGGYPKNPAWFHNLRANPDTAVQVGSRHYDVRALLAEGEERTRLWKLMVGVYGGYESYRRRAEREIPLVVLEPR
ncbi:MAG TPA: nitroreductase family deazaflavin-dependent oxidoreductase [Solirubrobacteraceae bacterium]|jgi:deazaflavin-dependent oxidoreductase (nitroreductase family)|nr:nitroreductase family deazaflavin-dependent oxidoreductase [Solirubrobacteraceae bacterium]